jgi:hypothetical protein
VRLLHLAAVAMIAGAAAAGALNRPPPDAGRGDRLDDKQRWSG